MQKYMSKLRASRALKHKTPAAADMNYKVGDKVLVWRTKVVDSRIGEWLGPFTVDGIDVSKKIVYVQDERIGAAKPFGIAEFNRYYEPATLASTLFSERRSAFHTLSTSKDDEDYLTEIIDGNDPRASLKEMNEAKKKKL